MPMGESSVVLQSRVAPPHQHCSAIISTFMFERYTEKARRVIFFARYEASQFGAPAIEPEHLLLGLMRED